MINAIKGCLLVCCFLSISLVIFGEIRDWQSLSNFTWMFAYVFCPENMISDVFFLAIPMSKKMSDFFCKEPHEMIVVKEDCCWRPMLTT